MATEKKTLLLEVLQGLAHKYLFKINLVNLLRLHFLINSDDTNYEVESMALIDIDNDNDLDLYLVSGGNQFDVDSVFYQDRLLIK